MCCSLEDHNISEEHKSCISPSHLYQHTMAVYSEICHTFKCHHRMQKTVIMMIVHVLSWTVHFKAEALGWQLRILATAMYVLPVDNAQKLKRC